MNSRAVPETVSKIVSPILDREGMDLVDVQFLRDSGSWVLRVFIDKPGGISLDDCTRISHKIGDVIEVEDVIAHRYRLEVSSPGLDRVLKKEADFQRFSGKKARVQTREPLAGRRNYRGKIVGCEQGVLALDDLQGNVIRLPLHLIEKARLEIDLGR
ncbi:MAG: ribosome maturation factor RimP [bacterium]